ncbi:MAG: hypothetical protein QGI83_13065 [Candidatus Latescibacteria bacterium]|jgi:hypothetical protein|nr:hypothetical protein [Candidatus Latescibacterota bacterium]
MTRIRATAIWTALLLVTGIGVAVPQAGDSARVRGLFISAGGPASSPTAELRSGSLGLPFSAETMSSSRYRVIPGGLERSAAERPVLEGDFNGDRSVDFDDFVVFATGFGKRRGQAGYDVRLDLDGDGAVAFGDFVRFAKAFGTGG